MSLLWPSFICLLLFCRGDQFIGNSPCFSLIFTHAFGLQEAAGGAIGAAIMQGVRRGLFSNEAGMGSVPNAAATANTSHPAKQGLVQSLGVFLIRL